MATPKKTAYPIQNERLGRLLATARKLKKLKQRELAARLGRPQAFITRYEVGKRCLDVMEFMAVTKAIGIDPRRIIGRLLKRWPDNQDKHDLLPSQQPPEAPSQ